MPDRIEELDHFTAPGLTMHPLPATEVRRRGTRMRRRNLALATAGTLAACALIGTPLVMLTGGQSDAPEIARQTPVAPVIEWQRTIPRDFPLGEGMSPNPDTDPATVGTQVGEVVFDAIDICGRPAWSHDAARISDVLGAVWSGGNGGEQRTLALYSSADRAQGALDVMAARVTGCPDQPPSDLVITPLAQESDAGDDSLAYVDQYADRSGPTGEGNAYLVVRVGNALLLEKTYFNGAGDPAVAQQTADLLSTRSASVVEQMCVFSETGC